MVNGHIDLEVILFKVCQYALVLFVGYLAWRGFLDWIDEIKDKRIIRLNQSIENAEARKKLWLANQEFKELKHSRKPLTFFEKLSIKIFGEDDDYVELQTLQSSPEAIVNEPISKEDLEQLNKDRLVVINEVHPEDETSLPKQKIDVTIEPFADFAKDLTPEETEGVDIPTLSDCLKKDPDFLAHSEDSNINLSSKSCLNSYNQEPLPKHKKQVKKKGMLGFFGFRKKK